MIIKTLILLFSSLLACTPILEVDDSSVEEVVLGVHAASNCSQIPGQSICNLVLKDQDDKVWQLHDLKGDVRFFCNVVWALSKCGRNSTKNSR